MCELCRLFQRNRILIADGATGTELARMGESTASVLEAWNVEHPERVKAVAEIYADTGADIILTNTLGGSRLKLARAGLDDRVEAINRVGAELACGAAGGRSLVFASVGPTGEFMAPLGVVSEREMVECFSEQISALVAGGVDGILIETMSDLGEAKAALAAARVHTGIPVVVSLTFEQGPAGYATMMGVRPAAAACDLLEAGADVVGANCGAGIEQIIEVVELIKPESDGPVWAKPNAGLPQLVDGRTVFSQSPGEMVEHFPALVAAGARLIGGCCGTTPGHIRALVEARDRLQEADD